ncbi:tonB-system energizer ExbB [Hyphomicrobium sp.]|uniref:tonB-system energizer ExbB n=1 Tax=Hyphomicrobium sp. TaxID=82 RepID=UPI003F708EEB
MTDQGTSPVHRLPFAILAVAAISLFVAASSSAQDTPAAPAAETIDAPASIPAAPEAPAAPTAAAPSPAPPDAATPQDPAPLQQDGHAEEAGPPVAGPAAAHLPRDLSPWNMFMSADIVVKAVMIGLAFASVVTWTIWLAKSLELAFAKRALRRASQSIAAAASLAEATLALHGRSGVVAGLIDMAALELRLSSDVADKAGIKERVASRLDGLTAAAGRDMNAGTGVLATIGSTAPFVGLFGTVWGIMNSFIGISEAQTTNLAIVAPGIAEALLATAIGLVAAIPAVIIYNQFARQISAYRAGIVEVSAEVLRLVSRDLDRGTKAPAAQAAE